MTLTLVAVRNQLNCLRVIIVTSPLLAITVGCRNIRWVNPGNNKLAFLFLKLILLLTRVFHTLYMNWLYPIMSRIVLTTVQPPLAMRRASKSDIAYWPVKTETAVKARNKCNKMTIQNTSIN